LLLLLFFFSLLTNSLKKKFQQNQVVQVLNFPFLYYRQCGFSLSTRTLLLPRRYPITATQKRRKAEELCMYPFSIIQARWGTSTSPDKIPATCNKQQRQQQQQQQHTHTQINKSAASSTEHR
jgi:hypothetical protein